MGYYLPDRTYLHANNCNVSFCVLCDCDNFRATSVWHVVWIHSHLCPVALQFWWTIGALGAVILLFFFFMEDTTYNREHPINRKPRHRSFIENRMATFLPGTAVVQQTSSKYSFVDPIVIGLQPVTVLSGLFLMLTFGWAVAVTTLLSVFLETPVEEGGYGFSPFGYSNVMLAQWIGVAFAETYALLFGDRLPLWRCRRNGGIWRPEFRLYPLLLPCLIILPTGFGIFGAALQYLSTF